MASISLEKIILRSFLKRPWNINRHFHRSSVICKDFIPVENIRNIGISAHIDSGKTTVTERILFYGGRIDQMHEVKGKDQVGATMDFMELERQRGITIQSAATYIDWKGKNINIIDTPGHVDFTVEVERALRVLDGAVLVLCGVAGVQSQTYTVNRQMTRYNVPFVAFINKLDRTNGNAYRTLDMMRKNLGHNAAFMQLPIGKESNFKGLVDLINRKALIFQEPDGLVVTEEDIPVEMRTEAEERRHELIEHVSNVDEQLGEIFLEEKTPSIEQLKAAIRRSVIKRKFTPVFMGTALKNKGVQPVLDAVVEYLPNPSEVPNYANINEKGTETKVLLDPARSNEKPFIGFAFKLESGPFGQLTYFRAYQGSLRKGDNVVNTRVGRRIRVQRLVRMHANRMEDIEEAFAGDIFATFGVECATGDTFTTDQNLQISCESMYVPEPVVSMSLKVKAKKDADNFMKALTRFTKEDPTFRKDYNSESKETIVSGMGELHLEIYSQRMKNEYNCDVELGKPKVAFRETLTAPVHFDYYHKKQTGGAGQYARVIGYLEPLPPEKNLAVEFVHHIYGGAIPANFIPAIEKGFRETCETGGPLMNQKITGIRMVLKDGAHHIVDSSELAFMLATKFAMHDTFAAGKWQLIEPVMKIEVTFPAQFHSDILVILSKRQALLTGSNMIDNFYVVMCEAPLNDMFGFITDLRRVSEGKGEYTMEFSRYTPVRHDVALKVIKQYRIESGLEVEEKKGAVKKKKN